MELQELIDQNLVLPIKALKQDEQLCTQVQARLKALGLLDIVDGIYGQNTCNAWAKFKELTHQSDSDTIGAGSAKLLIETHELPEFNNESDCIDLAIPLIKEFEGLRLKAYNDGLGVPTIGIGTTVYPNGKKVKMGDACTEVEAEGYLGDYINKRIIPALNKIPYWNEMTPNKKAALISFAYNLGEHFYGNSGFNSITNALKEKRWSDVPGALNRYVNPGSSVTEGLKRRRKAEGELWSKR